MRTKYYTPNIDEFNADFEFQMNNDDTWVDCKMKPEIIKDIVQSDRTRVKYLDADDIINLGFKLVSENNSTNEKIATFVRANNTVKGTHFLEVNLHYSADEPLVNINYRDTLLIDRLNIKNVSELKFILNRLCL